MNLFTRWLARRRAEAVEKAKNAVPCFHAERRGDCLYHRLGRCWCEGIVTMNVATGKST